MRRVWVLSTAGVGLCTLVIASLVVSRFVGSNPVIASIPANIEPELVTGTIAARFPGSSQPQPAPLPELSAQKLPAAAPTTPTCNNPAGLGISRTVEIDTSGGPGFGMTQYKAHDFLQPGEVVLTFDDGPWPVNTPAVLAALDAECIKATFFPIGKHATWHPEILKQVIAAGHTVGSHTWSHANLAKKTMLEAKDEIEKGMSAVATSAGVPISPFFRYPGLRQSPELSAYMSERNVATFSIDVDSFDFKTRKPEQVVANVMGQLKKVGKGIVLMHDFQRSTSVGLPALLAELKAGGYKVVHVKSKDVLTTLPQYDALLVVAQGGQTSDKKPTSSVVRTISTTVK